MRNLKKILALVLALMMVLSTMAVASATTFTDDADINVKYSEAVTVLSGIGVISGFKAEDGTFSFQPTGALTRAQAATIISYVLTGDLEVVEDEVSIYENPFTDVPEWAVPYVLYAHSNGIIVGRNATTFDPAATITGYELGKMLLIAGDIENPETELPFTNNDFLLTVYVVNGTAYTTENSALVASLNAGGAEITTKSIARSDWQVLVARGLKSAGIWNSEFKLSKKLTREEACYLAFNTLIASNLDTNVFGLEVNADVDAYGRTTKVYTSTVLEDLEIALDNYAAPTVKVATAAIDADKIVAGVNTLLGLKDSKALTAADDMIVYLNGAEYEGAINMGDTLEIFAANGKLTKVVVIREELVTASVAASAETEGDYKGLYKWTFGTAITYAAKDAYTKDAAYLVIADGEELLAVNNPGFIAEAKITKAEKLDVTASSYIYVGDKKVQPTADCAFIDGATFGVAYDYLLNSNGYLVAVVEHAIVATETKLETGYAYLLKAEKKVTNTDAVGSLIAGNVDAVWSVSAKAQLALADGTKTVVDLTTVTTKNATTGAVETLKINGTDASTDHDEAPVAILTDWTWVKYTIQEDKTYTLEELDITTLPSATLKENDAKIGSTGLFATSATVWTNYAFDPVTKTVVTTKNVGIGSFDGETYRVKTTVNANVNAKVATAIDTFGDVIVDDTSKVYEVYYKGTGDYVMGNLTYNFYANGELGDYYIALDDEFDSNYKVALEDLVAGGIYNLTVDTDGIVIGIETYYTVVSGVVEVADDDFIVINGVAYYYYNCEVYNVAKDHSGETDTIEVGDTVTISWKTYSGVKEALVAYITVEAE